MKTEKEEAAVRVVAPPEFIDTVRAGLRDMGESMPKGSRSVADCQALLGALMLVEAMGVPPEALEDLETAAGIGEDMALAELADKLSRETSRRLAMLEGCPSTLPCPNCAAQVPRFEPENWGRCPGCGVRVVISTVDEGVSFTYRLLSEGGTMT